MWLRERGRQLEKPVAILNRRSGRAWRPDPLFVADDLAGDLGCCRGADRQAVPVKGAYPRSRRYPSVRPGGRAVIHASDDAERSRSALSRARHPPRDAAMLARAPPPERLHQHPATPSTVPASPLSAPAGTAALSQCHDLDRDGRRTATIALMPASLSACDTNGGPSTHQTKRVLVGECPTALRAAATPLPPLRARASCGHRHRRRGRSAAIRD
jgi:hypothetical protein